MTIDQINAKGGNPGKAHGQGSRGLLLLTPRVAQVGAVCDGSDAAASAYPVRLEGKETKR